MAGLPGSALGRSTLLTTIRGANVPLVACTGTVVLDVSAGTTPPKGTFTVAFTSASDSGGAPSATAGSWSVPRTTITS